MSCVPNEIVAVMVRDMLGAPAMLLGAPSMSLVVIPKGSRPKTHDGGGTEYDQ